MTSALRGREGGWSKRDDSTDRLREWDSDKGGRGSKNPKILRTSFKYRPKDFPGANVNPLSYDGTTGVTTHYTQVEQKECHRLITNYSSSQRHSKKLTTQVMQGVSMSKLISKWP